jgi:drug/metabolite transporter (DMT)-like permease
MDGSIARPRPFLALGLRLAAVVALATMVMLVKLASNKGVHLAEMIFWRQFITMGLLTAGFLALGRLGAVKTKRFGAHIKRAIFGLTGMFFVYGAVVLLPLAEATALSFTAPFFAVMLGVILFKEKVGKYRWGAVLLGFGGVLVLTQPGSSSAAIDPFGIGVALVAAFLVAVISFQIQDLNKTETPWSIVFWFTVLTTPIAALAVPFVYVPHTMDVWLIIVAMAFAGAAGQLLLTSSLRYGSASVVLLLDYTSLLLATWYGYSVFDTAPSANLWLGAPLIIGAGLLIAYRERKLALKAKSGDKPA